MSFLKKLGNVLKIAINVAGVAAGVGPILSPLLGSAAGKVNQVITTANNDLTSIGSLVVMIETALQGKPGVEKLQALIPLVKNIVATSELVAGKKIANEAMFEKGVEGLAQGVVDVLNSLHEDAVKA